MGQKYKVATFHKVSSKRERNYFYPLIDKNSKNLRAKSSTIPFQEALCIPRKYFRPRNYTSWGISPDGNTNSSGSFLNWPQSHLHEEEMRESIFAWKAKEAY